MLGIGGNPVQLPANDNDYSNHCGGSACTGKEVPGSADAMICTGCRCPSYHGVYNASQGCTPCLFNVRSDPGERINLATPNGLKWKWEQQQRGWGEQEGNLDQYRSMLATMTSRLLELQTTRHDPIYPLDNFTAGCAAMRANGGYFGPWAVNSSNPPAPAPIPPTADCRFVGEMDQYPAAWQPGSRNTGVPAAGPESCCKLCKTDATCFVGVFKAGYCFFKPANATDRPRENCTSCYPKKK